MHDQRLARGSMDLDGQPAPGGADRPALETGPFSEPAGRTVFARERDRRRVGEPSEVHVPTGEPPLRGTCRISLLELTQRLERRKQLGQKSARRGSRSRTLLVREVLALRPVTFNGGGTLVDVSPRTGEAVIEGVAHRGIL